MCVRVFFSLVISIFLFLKVTGQDPDPAHEDDVTALAFSYDGNRLLTAGKDFRIRVWDVVTGDMLYARKVDLRPDRIMVSPDNKYFILSQWGHKNQLFDLKTGEKIRDLVVEDVRGFSPDGKNILVVTYENDGERKYASLGFADIKDEFFITYFSNSRIFFREKLNDPVVSHDGSHIFLPDENSGLFIFKKDDPFAEQKLDIPGEFSVLAVLPGDSAFVINGSDNLYQLEDEQFSDFLVEATFTDTESKIVAGGGKIINYSDGSFKIFNTETGEVLDRFFVRKAEKVAIDPSGMAVAWSEKGRVALKKLWNNGESSYLKAPDITERIAFRNYQEAIYFLNNKNYRRARDLFIRSEGKSDRLTKLYKLRGEVYFQMGFYEKAIRDFLIDQALYPGRSAYKIAESFAVMGEVDMALQWLDSSDRAGFFLTSFQLQGDTYFKAIRDDSVFMDYVKHLPGKSAGNWVRQSQLRFKNNEKLAALEYMNQAIAEQPRNPELFHKRALLYLKMHEFSKARKDYFKQAELFPDEAGKAYLNVALTYSKTGDLMSTISWIKKAIQIDSTLIGSLVDVAELYESLHRRDLALITLNEYLDLVPVDHYAVYLRASLMPVPEVALRETERAIELCEEQSVEVPDEYRDLLNALSASAKQ